MFALLRNLFGGSSDRTSKSVARSRLHFVLVQDRAGLTVDEMAAFKRELVGVIEKYFVIDEQGFDIDYRRDSESTTLLINSPVIVRRQDSPGFSAGAKRTKRDDKASLNGSAASISTEAISDPNKQIMISVVPEVVSENSGSVASAGVPLVTEGR